MADDFKNILIIKPSALGDVVMVLPALTALRKSYPDARISWLVRPEYARLIEGHPYLDEIIIFNRKLLGRAWYSPKAFRGLLSLISMLRQRRFDCVIDFQGLFRTAAFGWLSASKARYGPADAREFGHIFYTDKVTQDDECMHVVDYYLKMVQAAGAEAGRAEFVFPENKKAEDVVSSLLDSQEIATQGYVVFVPGSAHEEKIWPADRFAELAGRITSEYGLTVITVGTSPESALIEKIKEAADVPIVSLAGRLNLPELTALLKRARLVVSNDTGPGHIASGLGTPLVLMFGYSNPARIWPYGRKQCGLAAGVETRPKKIKSMAEEHSVKRISVEEVWQSLKQQLTPSNTLGNFHRHF